MEILNSGTKRSREIELRKCPSDLFHSFLPTSPNTTLRHRSRHQSPEPEKQQHGEEELNLGLSLGGRFGVDKSHKGLVRSSSLAAAIPLMRAEEAASAALVRTASLPPATEDEWRKRKDLQSLRRLEAKRKRSDKQRCIRENGSGENLNLNSDPGQHGKPNPGSGYPVHWATQAVVKSGFCGEFIQQQNQGSSDDSQGESLNLNPGLPGKRNLVSGYPKSGNCGDLQGLSIQQQKQDGCQGSSGDSQGEKSGICGDMQGLLIQQQKQDGSQGSGESQGASKSSSNASEPERNTIQGSCCGTRTAEVSSNKKLDSLDSQKDSSRGGESGMGNMPCVFTIGDGPKGRKVEGVLYRYKKGEEVRIMCICHGSFFTPAEFVNHAGAHNVAHPLKRIVVNPNASPF